MSVEVQIRHKLGDFPLDVQFAVENPGITALFGPSGSGKTSTINAIAGLIRPQSGRIAINGRVLLDTAQGIFVCPRRRRVGYVFQDGRLFPHMTVRSNLLFGWRRAGRPVGGEDIDGLINLLGLARLLDRKPLSLSGGERQRAALGRALLCKPELLLLDEPLAALDQARKAEIMPYLERLRDEAKIPMIYVSHLADEVARLADHIILLDHGRVAAQGRVADIMARLDLFPLTGRFEAGAVLFATVSGHDAGHALTELAFSGGRLIVPLIARPPGGQVRLRIKAHDVALSLARPEQISAMNILPAVISEIREDAAGPYADIQLACGSDKLLARITRRSAAELALRPGLALFAIIKSVNVERLAPGAPSQGGGGA